MRFCNKSTRFDRRAQNVQSAVYDVGYDTRMIKKRKSMVAVALLAAIKENNFARHRLQKHIKILKHIALFML